jgi:Polyketide cyclase / dehydrase and lipid transport
MWEYEYSLETSAGRGALWRHWADMAAWPQWNDGIETIDVDGPFAVGTTFTMTPPGTPLAPGGTTPPSPPGDQPIRMRLVEIEPGTSFTDEMDAGDFVVRTEHRLEPAAGGLTRIVYRMQITGEAAGHVGPELGPQITADFPEVVAALAGRAEG